MIIDNREFTIKYIDPSLNILDNQRDGLSPATAYKDFPTLEDNTCYLVRRTSNSGSKFYQGTYTGKNLFILGMPKSDELLYDQIPNNVKTVWGNDTADYANILFDRGTASNPTDNWTNTSQHYCILTQCNYMMLMNCRMYRTESTATNNRGPGFMLSNTSNSFGCYKIQNCWFGFGYDNIDSTFLAENSSIPSTWQNRCGQYLHFAGVGSISFDNCYIIGSEQSEQYSNNMNNFSITGNCDYFSLTNSECIHIGKNANNGNDERYTTCMFGNYNTSRFNNVIITNNTFCCLFTSIYLKGQFIRMSGSYTGNITMKNNKVKQLLMKDANKPTTLSYYTLFTFLEFRGYDIDNFNIDFTNDIVKITDMNVIYISDGVNLSPGIIKRSFKNISIKFYIDNDVVKYQNNSALFAKIEKHYSQANDYSTSETTSFYPPIFENLNIETIGNALTVYGCNVISGKCKGLITCEKDAYVYLDELTNLRPQLQRSVNIATDGTVRIKNLIFDTENALSPQITVTNDTIAGNIASASCLVDTASANPFLDLTGSGNNQWDKYCLMLCNNYNNNFYAKNSKTRIQSWSAKRNNGNNTLKLFNNVSDSQGFYLNLGADPLKGFKYNLTTGTYDFVCYFSAINFEQNLYFLTRFFVEVEVNGNIYSSNSGVIEEDTSTWSDENVKAYKLTIPNIKATAKPDFILTSEGNNSSSNTTEANIYIRYDAYDTNKYIYLDPAFQFISKSNS